MISKLKKKALLASIEIVMLSFFNKMTLNNLITQVSVKEDNRKLNLEPLKVMNTKAVIYQKLGSEPYFHIHESALITSFIDSLSSKEQEKTESNSLNWAIELEGCPEMLYVSFDESTLWVRVECEKLNELWSEMLRIKCLEM